MKVVAHRGASGCAPENTMLSLLTAKEMGADIVEFDVQLSKDNQVVLFHDRTFAKIDGTARTISELSLDEIRDIDVGSWMDAKFEGIGIPTLEEVLDRLSGYSCIVEIKNRSTDLDTDRILERKVLDVLDDSNGIGSGYISVRDTDSYQWFTSHTEKYKIGLMQKKRTATDTIRLVDELDLDIVQLRSQQFTEQDYLRLNEYSVESYVYWGNTPVQWDNLAKMNVTGVLTDWPGLMQGYLAWKSLQ